jgi:hypothetical protein
MKLFAPVLLCSAVTIAAGHAAAMDTMKKGDAMDKSGMTHKTMTMQECKDYMATAKKDNMKKDADAMKKDADCAAMMKKDNMSGTPAKK